MKKTLILGWGNPDREDDGAAWYVLAELARRLGLGGMDAWESGGELDAGDLSIRFTLQLLPELAETVAGFRRVCFVDAHTGEIPGEVAFRPVAPAFQASPFTHHLTPESCLAIAASFTAELPEAVLLSVRGYSFEFAGGLSPRTAALVAPAVDRIAHWLES